MRNISEIRHNIHTVEETRQITNAMFLLSTSRMKRAMQQIGYNQLYLREIRATVKDILDHTPEECHEDDIFTMSHEPDAATARPAFLVVSSDKGLCGAYNSTIAKMALAKAQQYPNAHICTIGQHAADTLIAHHFMPDVEFTGAAQRPDVYYSRAIGEHFYDYFTRGLITSVHIMYTQFHSQLKQEATCMQILPLLRENFADIESKQTTNAAMEYEPDVRTVYQNMVQQYTVGMVYDCLNQAACSEHVSRMTAMQNATKNADEMIAKLNLQYNSVRQLAITNEITEIAAATELADRAV